PAPSRYSAAKNGAGHRHANGVLRTNHWLGWLKFRGASRKISVDHRPCPSCRPVNATPPPRRPTTPPPPPPPGPTPRPPVNERGPRQNNPPYPALSLPSVAG